MFPSSLKRGSQTFWSTKGRLSRTSEGILLQCYSVTKVSFLKRRRETNLETYWISIMTIVKEKQLFYFYSKFSARFFHKIDTNGALNDQSNYLFVSYQSCIPYNCRPKKTKNCFYQNASFLGIIGLINGTQIPTQKPNVLHAELQPIQSGCPFFHHCSSDNVIPSFNSWNSGMEW